MEFTRQKVAEAMESGIDPLSDRAAPVIDDLVHRFAEVFARTPDTQFREWMAQQFEESTRSPGGPVLAVGVDRQRLEGSTEPDPGVPLAHPGPEK